jgi:hypothetical protein
MWKYFAISVAAALTVFNTASQGAAQPHSFPSYQLVPSQTENDLDFLDRTIVVSPHVKTPLPPTGVICDCRTINGIAMTCGYDDGIETQP